MKKMISLFAFLFSFSVLLQAQSKVIFSDDFSNNNNKWLVSLGPTASYLVYDGKLVIDKTDSLTYNLYTSVNINTANNYTITITATHTDGTENSGYGLAFGASDVNNYYSFNISSNGYFRVNKNTSGGGFTDIVKWTICPAVKTGNYVDNILQVKKDGANWIFSINGQVVSTIPAMDLMGNFLGANINNPQRVEFDDLKVMQ